MNKKNWLLLILVSAIAFTSFSSCSKDDDEETTEEGTEWTRSVPFKNDPRNGAASFTIDDKGYVIGGYVKNVGVVNDGAAFDGSAWSDIPDFEGAARQQAVGFSIDGIGFVGTGSTGTEDLQDFYKYDSRTKIWTKIADFKGKARYGAVAFSLGGYGYVGLGRTKTEATFSDFYRYDPKTDTWTEIESPFLYKKAFAFSFVIDGKAYVGGGQAISSTLPEDFFSFDGTKWTRLNDLNRDDANYTYDARKYSASSFVIGNKAYVVSGRGTTASVTSAVFEYDPASDTWNDDHNALTTDSREKAVGFGLKGVGYITTGVNSSFIFDSTFAFKPE